MHSIHGFERIAPTRLKEAMRGIIIACAAVAMLLACTAEFQFPERVSNSLSVDNVVKEEVTDHSILQNNKFKAWLRREHPRAAGKFLATKPPVNFQKTAAYFIKEKKSPNSAAKNAPKLMEKRKFRTRKRRRLSVI